VRRSGDPSSAWLAPAVHGALLATRRSAWAVSAGHDTGCQADNPSAAWFVPANHGAIHATHGWLFCLRAGSSRLIAIAARGSGV